MSLGLASRGYFSNQIRATDTTPPTITIVSPPVGSTITDNATITFDFLDDVGLGRCLPAIRFNKIDGSLDHYELIHDGIDFTPDYTGTRQPIPGGWQYAIQRRAGWSGVLQHVGGNPILVPFGTDTQGNEVNP